MANNLSDQPAALSNPKYKFLLRVWGAMIQQAQQQIRINFQLIDWHGHRLAALESRMALLDGQPADKMRREALDKVIDREPDGILFEAEIQGEVERLVVRKRRSAELLEIAREWGIDPGEFRERAAKAEAELATAIDRAARQETRKADKPPSRAHRTRVTKHDEAGRILEFIKEEIEIPNNEGEGAVAPLRVVS